MKFRTGLLLVLIGFSLVNAYMRFIKSDPVLSTKLGMVSLSKGERYFSRLKMWRYLATQGEWEKANKLEDKLDREDIEVFKKENYPPEIITQLNDLYLSAKSADDWVKITRMEIRLGRNDKAKEAISNAYKIDPIRDDISKLYFSLSSLLP